MIFFYGILFIIAVTFLWVISTNEYARLVQEGKSRPRALFGLAAGLDEHF
ncbi:hypothetical protein AAULR_01745 [Lacticaseibacillus rhamnosus MTCC 5462]|nr:hypothetical protein AAULR_01745 [Lacticaseibacillus rhamnosus MTCC 5462]